MKKFFLACFFLPCFMALSAMDTGQRIYNGLVRTLKVSKPDNFFAPPVLRLGSNERLDINFDIIGDDFEYLKYRLIHCNADWQPSRLVESEYIDGFNEGSIEDYAFSSNTYTHYVNYNISLPDPQMPLIASGNYLLQVYPEGNPDEILLQTRFSVVENASFIQGGYTTKTDRGVNDEYQQLYFNLDINSFPSINPYQDLIIEITQNNRPETTKFITHPMRVDRGRVVYEHLPELIFESGNEYRRFETVRTDYPGMRVDSVKFINGMWNAWVIQDVDRVHSSYVYDNTQQGRFKIDEYNSTDPDLSADYVLVHFSLDPGSNPSGNIYIDGDFTNHTFDSSNLMRYDMTTGLYQTSIPLKQGSYNYQYVVIPENGGVPTTRLTEGNKYETQNEYLIKAYLRTPGARADRLIGYLTIR